MGKKIILKQNASINNDGDSLIETIYSSTIVSEEPPYFKMYIKELFYLVNLKSTAERAILVMLLKNMGYDNISKFTISDKDDISKLFDIKIQTINNALSKLLKTKDLFRKLKTTKYEMNPKYFGKGGWKDIRKIIIECDDNAMSRVVIFEPNNQSN